MEFVKTSIEDVVEIKPKVFGDERGYFYESFRYDLFEENIGKLKFVQHNVSKSSYGVLRGLHFQTPPFTQSKLVTALVGQVLDVAVDIRIGSPTYGQHVSVILDSEKKNQLWVPQGFAHGFIVLGETAVFSYMVDNYYAPDYDSGIMWNDPNLNIDWVVPKSEIKLSAKDLSQTGFELANCFTFEKFERSKLYA